MSLITLIRLIMVKKVNCDLITSSIYLFVLNTDPFADRIKYTAKERKMNNYTSFIYLSRIGKY